VRGSPAVRLYFDYASTTPVRPEVVAAMLPHLGDDAFNPSSLHTEGRRARAALDGARATIARLLGAEPREIVFTGNGSEADNLAIVGGARAARRKRGGAHAITAATEHRAVLGAFDVLRDEGFAVTVLEVDGEGRIAVDDFVRALRPGTVLASIMLANNELGTLQPIAAFAEAARARGVLFHTDAVQAAGRLPLDVVALGVDLLTLSAHKIYGPKGIGLLYVRAGTPLQPCIVGGPQEAGLRAGTENVAGAVGFARALELGDAERALEGARLTVLRDRLQAGLAAAIPGVRLNGAGAERLPNVLSIACEGVEAAELLVRLDLDGVAVSAGSACAAGAAEASHVIAALPGPAWTRSSTIRISLGRATTAYDVERLVRRLSLAVAEIRVAAANLGTSHSGSRLWNRSEVRS
jgi:cysteine desulfurase